MSDISIPDNWTLSTNLDHHLIYQELEPPNGHSKRTIVLTNGGISSNWKVKGLVGFDTTPNSEYPIFAKGITLSQAKQIAEKVMRNPSETEPIETEILSADNNTVKEKSQSSGESDAEDDSSPEAEDDQMDGKDSPEDKVGKNKDDNKTKLTDFM